MKDRYKYRNELNNVLGTLFNFYLTYLILGMIWGFKDNSYSFLVLGIMRNVIKSLFLVSIIEIPRIFLIKKMNGKKEIVVVTLALILIEIAFNMKRIALNNFYNVMIAIARYLMPIVGTNILLSYINYKYDYKISLVYTIIVHTYLFFMKTVPDIGDSFYGILLFLLSYATYIRIDSKTTGIRKMKAVRIIILIMYIIFYSGIFSVRLIPVYDSYVDTIIKGDAVIVYNDEVKINDYIVYTNNNLYIVSKVVKIDYFDDVQYYYVKTSYHEQYALVSDNNLCGVIKKNIPYMGYVPVLINGIGEAIINYITDLYG